MSPHYSSHLSQKVPIIDNPIYHKVESFLDVNIVATLYPPREMCVELDGNQQLVFVMLEHVVTELLHLVVSDESEIINSLH